MSTIDQVTDMLLKELEVKLKQKNDCDNEIAQFALLPKGNVYVKTVYGKDHYYHQYYCDETKKGRTIYLPSDQGIAMKKQTDRRLHLAKLLKSLSKEIAIIEKMLKPTGKNTLKTDSISSKLQEIRTNSENANVAHTQSTLGVQSTPYPQNHNT